MKFTFCKTSCAGTETLGCTKLSSMLRAQHAAGASVKRGRPLRGLLRSQTRLKPPHFAQANAFQSYPRHDECMRREARATINPFPLLSAWAPRTVVLQMLKLDVKLTQTAGSGRQWTCYVNKVFMAIVHLLRHPSRSFFQGFWGLHPPCTARIYGHRWYLAGINHTVRTAETDSITTGR